MASFLFPLREFYNRADRRKNNHPVPFLFPLREFLKLLKELIQKESYSELSIPFAGILYWPGSGESNTRDKHFLFPLREFIARTTRRACWISTLFLFPLREFYPVCVPVSGYSYPVLSIPFAGILYIHNFWQVKLICLSIPFAGIHDYAMMLLLDFIFLFPLREF